MEVGLIGVCVNTRRFRLFAVDQRQLCTVLEAFGTFQICLIILRNISRSRRTRLSNDCLSGSASHKQ